ncbi:Hypothetical predicted protein, partial [Mytilus galloprovincialis]
MAIPGGPMEICFSFDTTGSMGACINEVKGKVQDLIQRLQADIPGIRMAVFAHGDYCDKDNYITKHIDFSTDATELCNWVKTVGTTGGGDGDECYELVLQEVQSLSWTPGSKRALVMIGDADPHEPGYNYGGKTYKIDWRDETYKLLMMVNIYLFIDSASKPRDIHDIVLKEGSSILVYVSNIPMVYFDFIVIKTGRQLIKKYIITYKKEDVVTA